MENGEEKSAENPDYNTTMDGLFVKAKEKDEFEYVSSLLRIRGTEGPGWDPLVESWDAIQDYLRLCQTPFRDITRFRLFLLIYSHITEIDTVYDMLANMLRTIKGDRCSMIPFDDYAKATKKRVGYPAEKIAALKEMESALGLDLLGKLFDLFFDNDIRNAFYHSNYSIFENEFRYRKKYAVAVPIPVVVGKIEKAINFYLSFMGLYQDHVRSYKTSKIIKGRIAPNGGWLDVELLVDKERGVYGFRNPPSNAQASELGV